jgi:hypothetical protein
VVPPLPASAPMTADVRRQPRRGTSSAYATKMRMHLAQHERVFVCARDASFARSFDPCTSILTTHRGSNPRWWGARGGITVGQNRASGRNQHWGHRERTERGSPRVSGFARNRAWHERKGWRSRPPSLRGLKSSGLVARTSNRSCRSR